MSTTAYDVLGIGHALVDVLAKTTEDFLAEQDQSYGMKRGAMSLISQTRAVELYALIHPETEMSGGSAANSIAHLAKLGGRGAYIGKVADDSLGTVFSRDLRDMGVHYATTPLSFGGHTGRCMILVSDDATRTMNTYLGAASELRVDDIDQELVEASAVTFLEGYLFDAPHCKDAFFAAGDMANKANRRMALTLSDLFCVERHRDDFIKLIDHHIDILFANESEIKSLAQTEDLNTALNTIRGKCEVAAVTLGSKGSIILSGDQTFEIPAEKPNALVDTTGAGDAYAAGFLYGFTRGLPLPECGKIACQSATSVLSYMGPRPLAKAA